MEKNYILALLSGTLLFANSVFGKAKAKEESNLENMKTPNEASADSPKKTPNPFPEQDKDLVSIFNPKNTEGAFSISTEDPFKEVDPWDD